jgi:hypothetical protein
MRLPFGPVLFRDNGMRRIEGWGVPRGVRIDLQLRERMQEILSD